MARVSLVIDCHDPDRLAEFWCEVLGFRPHGEVAQYRAIVPGKEPRYEVGAKLILQRVPEPKSGKNRLHLDLDLAAGDSLVDELDRIRSLGGSDLGDPHEEFGLTWQTMADPEGNEFCVVGPPPG